MMQLQALHQLLGRSPIRKQHVQLANVGDFKHGHLVKLGVIGRKKKRAGIFHQYPDDGHIMKIIRQQQTGAIDGPDTRNPDIHPELTDKIPYRTTDNSTISAADLPSGDDDGKVIPRRQDRGHIETIGDDTQIPVIQ